MKRLLSFLFLILFFFILTPQVLAANLNIECFGTGTCTKTGQDPLFSKALDGYWMPGDSASKTFKITNSAAQTREAFMKPVRTSSAGILENVMDITLFPFGGGSPNWSGTLANFYNLGDFSLGNIPSGGNAEYVISARMKPEANNDYQGKSTVFDLNFSFWVESAPIMGLTSTNGRSDDGPLPCTDAKPGTPVNFTANPGPGADQASLFWTGVSPFTYFVISYSDTPDSPKWGNPDVGNVLSYTVSGLPNGTYYFWVRGQNGCMPGDPAGPAAVTLTTSTATGIAPGFLPGVLGEATPSAEISKPGETLGEGVSNILGTGATLCQECLWWPILLGEAIVLLAYYLHVLRKNPSRKRYLFSTLIPVLTFIIFLLLNRNCFGGWFYVNSNSFYCKYFWLFDLILFILMLIYSKINSSKENNG